MNDLFLGVDGGQSGTTAVIGDANGKVAGWASAGPCNHVTGPEARARFLNVMRECVAQAARSAGVNEHSAQDHPRWRFRAACLGMSGGPDDKAALLREIIDADHLTITHDAMIALAGAISGEPGIIVIAGTGSIAFGQNAKCESARAGGWGYIFGDEGSAFDVSRQALRAVLREHEGWGPHTALTPALLELARASDPNQMLHAFYTPEWPRSRVASLAATVNRIAEEGDPIAAGILQHAAEQLALLAASVRQQLWTEQESAHVSWTGGVFSSMILRDRFRSVVESGGNAVSHPPSHGPAIGALLLAWRSSGVRFNTDFIPVDQM
jgi:N-acetylglucosamine kinase-like BadF-type ATPase